MRKLQFCSLVILQISMISSPQIIYSETSSVPNLTNSGSTVAERAELCSGETLNTRVTIPLGNAGTYTTYGIGSSNTDLENSGGLIPPEDFTLTDNGDGTLTVQASNITAGTKVRIVAQNVGGDMGVACGNSSWFKIPVVVTSGS